MFRESNVASSNEPRSVDTSHQQTQIESTAPPPNPGRETKSPPAAAVGGQNALDSKALPKNDIPVPDRRLSSDSQMSGRTQPSHTQKTRRKRKAAGKGATKDSTSTEKGHKRSCVEHRYHDHSNEVASNKVASSSSKSKGGVTTPFPMQLHDMLQHADLRGFTSIVSWQPHGRAFLVHDHSRFVTEVMPMFSRQTRMSSFQRQLSLYGFLRLTKKGTDHGAYYHELFLRGMPHLCRRMQRTRVKGYWVRQSSSPETEPDFSSMPEVGQPAASMGAAGTVPQQLPTAVVTTVAPVSKLDSLWFLPRDDANAAISSNKVEPSFTALAAAGDLPSTDFMGVAPHLASLLGHQNGVKVPPVSPLGEVLPLALATPLDTATIRQPASNPMFTAPSMTMEPVTPLLGQQNGVKVPPDPPLGGVLPISPLALVGPLDTTTIIKHPASKPMFTAPSITTEPVTASTVPQKQQHPTTGNQDVSSERDLETRFLDMSGMEITDMVSFLSDVDLSGDENSADEYYEEESKIAEVGGECPTFVEEPVTH